MKSYTDLEQSKKLTEILSLESADMMYSPPMLTHFKNYGDADKEQELPDYMVINVRRNIIDSSKFDEPISIRKGDFPCWSLAALLSILPFPVLYMKMVAGMILWCCECHFMETDEVIKIEHYNPIDACYEMILKLNEKNLL